MDNKFAAKSQEQLLIQRLLQVPLFQRLTSKQIQILLKSCQRQTIEVDESLWIEGDPSQEIYLLIKGQLAVCEKGKEIDRLQPIASVGEIPFFAGLSHDDEIVALEPCLLLKFSYQAMQEMLCVNPDICQRLCRNVIGLLSLRLQKANERLGEIAHQQADLEKQIEEAEIELNDLNLIRGMHS